MHKCLVMPQSLRAYLGKKTQSEGYFLMEYWLPRYSNRLATRPDDMTV